MADEIKEYLDYEGLEEYHKKSSELFQDLTIQEVEEAFNELDESDPSYSAFYDVISKAKEATQNAEAKTADAVTATTKANEATSKADTATERANKAAEKLETVNDMTTGINLLRGTRDFVSGTIKSSYQDTALVPSLFTDGFYIYLFNKVVDDEGYTNLQIERSGLSSNVIALAAANVIPLNGRESITVSFEVKSDNLTSIDDRNIAAGRFVDSSDKAFDQTTLSIPSEATNGEWTRIVHTFTPSKEATAFVFWIRFARNGSICFRKLNAQQGSINNPIWSPAPADLSLEPINDITTGVNLLRGTRDFIAGMNSAVGSSSRYTDGFAFATNSVFSVDSDGFTNLECSAPSISPLIKYDQGESYTGFCEVKFNTLPNADSVNLLRLAIFEVSTTVNERTNKSYTYGDLKATYGEIEVNKWYKINLTGSFTNSYVDSRLAVYIYNGIFRKVGLVAGSIEHPEWSASPFDIDRINDLTTTTNLCRGTREFVMGTQIWAGVNRIDGFYQSAQNFTFYKDDDGFTVAHISRSGLTSNNVVALNGPAIVGVSVGDQITFSIDVMIEDVAAFYKCHIINIQQMGSDSGAIDTFTFGLEEKGITPESGKWYRLNHTVTITDSRVVAIKASARIERDGTVNFKKLAACKGKVEHLEWSPNPFDADHNNKTGINLLRGTRDFTVRTNTGSSVGKDGFFFSTSGNTATTTFSTDSEGFTICNMTATGLSANIHRYVRTSAIFNVQAGDMYTISFDIMIDDVSALPSKIIGDYEYFKESSTNREVYGNIYFSDLGIPNPESKKWYRVTYNHIVPANANGMNLVFQIFLVMNGSINLRKFTACKGFASELEWSASPFDVASSEAIKKDVTDLSQSMPNTFIMHSSINPTDYPTNLGGNRCLVINFHASPSYAAQLAFSFEKDMLAFRRKTNSSTFTSWVYTKLGS